MLLDRQYPDEFGRTDLAQPALFALEYSLASWLTELGLRPDLLIGHSAGEVAAACFSGAYALPEASRLAVLRGQALARLPVGQMLAVPLPERELLRLLHDHAAGSGSSPDLAAVNAADRCVVSGSPAAIESFAAYLRQRDVPARPLPARHPFHSRQVDPLVDDFTKLIGPIPGERPHTPVISTATGDVLDSRGMFSAGYWGAQARNPVRFAQALTAIPPGATLIEAGPGLALSNFARRELGPGVVAMPLLGDAGGRPGQPPSWLGAVGALWDLGYEIGWERLGNHVGTRKIPLPTYPFEPVRHWFEPVAGSRVHAAPQPSAVPDAPTIHPSSLHVLEWTAVAPPRQRPQPAGAVVLADARGIGEAIAGRLRAGGCRVRTLSRQSRDGLSSAGTTPSADETARLGRLAADLAAAGTPPDAIVNCWPIDQADRRDATAGQLTEGATQTVIESVQAARAFGDAFPGRPIRILLVTNAAHGVGGQPPRTPQAAATVGPARVIPLELPALEVRAVDLDCDPADPGAVSSAADAVLAELTADDTEAVVARRGRTRLVQRLSLPHLVDEPVPAPGPQPGSYLITGGLGGIGLAIAGRLARGAGYTVLLLSRRPVADGSGWDIIRPPGAPVPTGQPACAAVLAELAANGTQVCLLQADVTDDRQLAEVLGQARARHGRISGVVHAAGIAGGRTAALLDAGQVARVMDPKVARGPSPTAAYRRRPARIHGDVLIGTHRRGRARTDRLCGGERRAGQPGPGRPVNRVHRLGSLDRDRNGCPGQSPRAAGQRKSAESSTL